ncbi:hypothetical protein HPB47_017396 [Ixodes persulcatus]|uniref:Uncharacterized protein n=1 Tax=Ixodes persulcatus TaxID=34615 RepID=A0AC60QPB9_IXOPE|nr:hypothetical protein HPB47_017396 [Ixodes persulcatus]
MADSICSISLRVYRNSAQADAVLTLSYGNVPEPRLHACLELLEDIFATQAVRVATVALQDAVDDLPGTVVHWVWEARQVLRPRLAAWVTSIMRSDTGENVDKDVLDTVNSLNLLEAATFNGSGKDSSDMSIFSWLVLYEPHRRALVIPQGLLGVLVNASSTVEPIFVPAVGAQILRALLPRRNGPYPWPRSHHVHLHRITGCFARSLHIDTDIALEVARESAVLVPLFDLYRRKVREEFGDGTRLHPDHTNGQLFFVLWALGHCGETDGAVLVNGAAKHSALFQRTFYCQSGQSMSTGKQCSFWQ